VCCELDALELSTGNLTAASVEEPSLQAVLSRAAEYVTNFSRQLSGIVAEEFYIQEVRPLYVGSSATRLDRRELRSDFLLVLPAGADRYVEFRDVFEVDGNPIRDRSERLTKLFLDPATKVDQMGAIIKESARLNIGADIPRNINTPMLPLHFLLPAQRPRFKFSRGSRKTPNLTGYDAPRGGEASFRASTEVWVVDFEETRRGTIIRTHEGLDFPAKGRFWIEPDTGTVMMTELVLDRGVVRAVIDVSYESEPLLGFRVPVEMRERYVTKSQRIDGVARYGKFRQFQVRTEEKIESPDATKRKPPPR
jgi:hypothetical protein